MDKMFFILPLLSLGLALFPVSTELQAGESGLITGSVYCDLNYNGRLDEGEEGLENIHVQLFADYCGGTALQMIHTDRDGKFIFRGYEPGAYLVRADLACVCGGRQPTTTTCQRADLRSGESVNLPPFGYSDYGQ